MAQLLSFRKGWQSQNIARAIIYEFSFINEPVYNADDVGADFYCTLFDKIKDKKSIKLIPKNLYMLQIKSKDDKNDEIDITKYLPILSKMELPFFIGIVDRGEVKITFYSGEFIPFLHAYIYEKLEDLEYLSASLLDEIPTGIPSGDHWLNHISWFSEKGKNQYNLLFPKITELSLKQEESIFEEGVVEIKKRCEIISRNLASCRKEEFIFEDTTSEIPRFFFTRIDGLPSIQKNIDHRLAEMFYHFEFLYSKKDKNMPKIKKMFLIYEEIYQLLLTHRVESEVPEFLTHMYLKAKKIITETQ